MSVSYTPNKADAKFQNFTGQAFDDPVAYSAANAKRIDAKFFLKPLQDEVLQIISLLLSGGGALSVRNETGGSLSAGPVRITGYSVAHSSFKIAAANAAGAQAAHALLLASLANNTNGVAYSGGTLPGALNTGASSEGAPVYLAAGGGLTLSAPSGADEIVQRVGRVRTVAASGDVAGLVEPPVAHGTSYLQAAAVTAAKLNSSAIDVSICEGRLTTESGVPVSASDRTAQGTLYFTPFHGNRIALYDGSNWKLYTFSELSISAGGGIADRNYDIFAYDNGSGVVLEAIIWTNDTTRGTALALQDGVYVKSGATTRRYIGTYRSTSTTTTEDSETKRLVWNARNQVRRKLFAKSTTNSNTSSNAAFEAYMGETIVFHFVRGLNEQPVRIAVQGVASHNLGSVVAVGVGIDSNSSNSAEILQAQGGTTYGNPVAIYQGLPAAGYHYAQMLQYAGSATATFYGDSGVSYVQSGMEGEVWG